MKLAQIIIASAIASISTAATAAENVYIGGDRFFTLGTSTEEYGVMPISGQQAVYYTQKGAISALNSIAISGAAVNAEYLKVTYNLIQSGEFGGKKGIVFILNGWGPTDHIDLWDGQAMRAGQADYFALGQEVWFWELI